jgi:hypothetical protein
VSLSLFRNTYFLSQAIIPTCIFYNYFYRFFTLFYNFAIFTILHFLQLICTSNYSIVGLCRYLEMTNFLSQEIIPTCIFYNFIIVSKKCKFIGCFLVSVFRNYVSSFNSFYIRPLHQITCNIAQDNFDVIKTNTTCAYE